ncbi:hypothetical protein [Terribacillus sp. 7520-G]|uniref:hypothetical protein n=1 Tax=Terribacillus TaxID=459532 RepID=UPI000BA54B72|nr:hypothetical protein [Terribacillus sp. 7520-G]PAD38333.1 hypothetical protein CHH53_11435 [Terribacillus sp. 7520-G]
MEILWSFVVDIVSFILEAMIPSKKRRRYKKNVRTLKKQDWFRKLAKNHGPMFYKTLSIRAKITDYNDSLNLQDYRQELEQTAKREISR